MSQWLVVLEAFTNGFPVLISHFVVAVLILLSGVFIYVRTSAWNDLELIRSGNLSASISLGGAFLSLSIPLSASLTTVGGISGGPLFNSESKIIGVTIAEQVRRGTVSSADLKSINWLLGAVKNQTHSQSKIQDEINPENFNDFADTYRGEPSIVQLVCNTA